MAVSYSTKKCDSCGGSLEYIREKKLWRCRYCGQEIVREETYDGLFTIKNVARQTLVDTAYRRMDQAERNLTECEKIDTSYVGTVIARIGYRLIAVITPGACQQQEVRSMYQRLKDDYAALKSKWSGISEEEESFYEFIAEGDSASDAFALLVLVFDTLGDSQRTERLTSMLDTGKVYSKACNKDLLSYALKSGNMDMAKTISANTDNLDMHSALDVVLDKCPDGSAKAEIARPLLEGGAYGSQDRSHMREYLAGGDGCATKAAVLAACRGTGAVPDMETVIRCVLSQATPEQTSAVLDSVCDGHLLDSELYELIEYALGERAEQAAVILDKIAASGQFAILSAKHLIRLFSDTGRSADERLAVWEHLQPFRLDGKAAETALAVYLCEGADETADRQKILTALLALVRLVTPACLERYLLNCTLDGEAKPVVVKQLFALEEMRSGYFNAALGKYLRNPPDEPAVAQQVADELIRAGLALDAGATVEIVCRAGMAAAEKIELLRKLEQNGCSLRADALSVYLETCVQEFDETLFSYLFDKTSSVSERALCNYVLYCAHQSSVKVRNASALAARQSAPFGASTCRVTHLSHQLVCNLAQAYLLTTAEPYETAQALLQAMSASGRLTADIQADGNLVRMKKYVKENRTSFSPLTEQLCNDHRLFSLF